MPNQSAEPAAVPTDHRVRRFVGRVTPCAPSADGHSIGPFTTLSAGRGLPALPGALANSPSAVCQPQSHRSRSPLPAAQKRGLTLL